MIQNQPDECKLFFGELKDCVLRVRSDSELVEPSCSQSSVLLLTYSNLHAIYQFHGAISESLSGRGSAAVG